MIIIDPESMEELTFILPDNQYKRLAISLGSEIKRLFYLDDKSLKIYVLDKPL